MADLFAAVKDKSTRGKMNDAFQHIVKLTQVEPGYAVIPEKFAAGLKKVQPNLLDILTEKDFADNVNVRATAAGLAAAGGSLVAPASDATPAADTPKWDVGLAVPEANKRGGFRAATDKYGFATAPLGGSFFVPATAEVPNPTKKMSGLVSSINRRFASTYPMTQGKDKQAHPKAGQPTGKDGRKFVVRPRKAEDENGVAGCRVYRIQ